ncbi:FCS-Like Zinc finger 8-like [Rhododendron vialii]|uniref:FCS-Like Zinc finger 8-like n=1 Tax=Rhododendron vialii TaxID=182163 RepID=UPI00265F1190|nr:FCS-Like Zinc finger 8-like [Rhododendron vialii]
MDTVTSSNSKSRLNSSDLSSENGLLGILDLITDDESRTPVMEVSDKSSKINNLIFGPHLVNLSSISNHLINESTVPKSTPSNDQNTLDRETVPMAITASQILLSEDYTRVTCYGPNPRITHIFLDLSLEFHPNRLIIASGKKREEVMISLFHQVATCSGAPSVEFPNLCEACSKKMEVGEDVYIYRGKSSFCSYECLAVGILAEEISKAADKSLSFSGNDELMVVSAFNMVKWEPQIELAWSLIL